MSLIDFSEAVATLYRLEDNIIEEALEIPMLEEANKKLSLVLGNNAAKPIRYYYFWGSIVFEIAKRSNDIAKTRICFIHC